MAVKTKKTIPVTINLTPEQIREAYFELVKSEHEDWFYEPVVTEELLKRDRQALKEFKEKKTISWEKLKKELGI